jgi:hypothetical protein
VPHLSITATVLTAADQELSARMRATERQTWRLGKKLCLKPLAQEVEQQVPHQALAAIEEIAALEDQRPDSPFKPHQPKYRIETNEAAYPA